MPALATRMSSRPSRAIDGEIFEIPDASVGNENVQPSEPGDSVLNQFLVFGVLADISFECFHASAVLAGFLLDLKRGVFGFGVVKDDVGAGLREKFDGGGPDAA